MLIDGWNHWRKLEIPNLSSIDAIGQKHVKSRIPPSDLVYLPHVPGSALHKCGQPKVCVHCTIVALHYETTNHRTQLACVERGPQTSSINRSAHIPPPCLQLSAHGFTLCYTNHWNSLKEQEGFGFNAHFCGVLGYRKGLFSPFLHQHRV